MKIPSYLLNPFNNININKFDLTKYENQISKLIKNKKKNNKIYDIVIMSAGKNSRINVKYPKSLIKLKYPNKETTLIENLINILLITKIKINKIYLIVRKEHQSNFNFLKKKYSKIELVDLEENQIKGTTRCLIQIYKKIESKDFILMWGDIALISRRVIHNISILHEKYNTMMSFPTCIKKDPYLSIQRNKYGNINKVKHYKKNIIRNILSEQDLSFFFCKTKIIKYLIKFENEYDKNKECDFIKFLPYISNYSKILSPPIGKLFEVEGINYKQDLKKIKKKLLNYNYQEYINNYL